MTPPAATDQWWVIIEASGKPFDDWDGATVLFRSQAAARRWMSPNDPRVERWDGFGPSRIFNS